MISSRAKVRITSQTLFFGKVVIRPVFPSACTPKKSDKMNLEVIVTVIKSRCRRTSYACLIAVRLLDEECAVGRTPVSSSANRQHC